MVKALSRLGPDPVALRVSASTISRRSAARFGGVVATTFRNFPSFPQRYMEALEMPAADPFGADRAAQAGDAAGAVHRRRPAHPAVHRRQHPAPDAQGPAPRRLARTLTHAVCAPTNRVTTSTARPSRSTRTTPRELGACTNSSPPTTSRRATPPGAARVEEHQVAGRGLPARPVAGLALRGDRPRNGDAVLGEDVPDEAAAVEPARIAAAVAVRDSAQGQRRSRRSRTASLRCVRGRRTGFAARARRRRGVGNGLGTAPVEAQPVGSRRPSRAGCDAHEASRSIGSRPPHRDHA